MESKLITTINLLRKTGFFSSFEGDASEIAEKIIEKSQTSYFGDILNLENEPLYEQVVLSYDKEICWLIEDINGYYLSDETSIEVYYNVFCYLKIISKGLFSPENIMISECGYCEGRDKRVKLNFLLENKEKSIVFCADGWSLTLSFLDEINLFIKDTAHSFECIIDNYGVCFVYFLNQKQKEFLTEELKWNFISNTSYWADKAVYFREIKNPEKAEECFKRAIIKHDNINSVVQYAIFLKENSRISEALSIFELGKNILDKQTFSIENRQWWLEFIDGQLNSIEQLNENN